jgi:hypothetical protein
MWCWFAIAGLPEPLIALHRVVATMLGGVIALFAHLLGIGGVQLWRRYVDIRGVSRAA